MIRVLSQPHSNGATVSLFSIKEKGRDWGSWVKEPQEALAAALPAGSEAHRGLLTNELSPVRCLSPNSH